MSKTKSILKWAIPLMMSNMVDAFIIGRPINTHALATVGIGDYIVLILIYFFISLGMG
ncbi:hypothetical protein [Alkalibaculum bacchi]|uniref:hypothetical protein n=1 Tax=Alkalibaculum bacchi TaxID=645887 RepID=UPI0026EEE7A1|nr:hypothetical protein [Alkalibaculum bacchi]